MSIEIATSCPLGSKCEEIKNDKMHRCRWYVCLGGQNPQTGEIIDKWDCAMAWIPIMLVENANTNRGQTAALESFRNEMVEQNDAASNSLLSTLSFALANKKPTHSQLIEELPNEI